MNDFEFFMYYFFIEPLVTPWTVVQKIELTTTCIMLFLLSLDMGLDKWKMRKYNKKMEARNS